METLKCNICGSDVIPVSGRPIARCVRCGSQQTYAAPAAQEHMGVSNTDIVDEIDSLLNLYKIALEGDVWSGPGSIFDHIQDIEYELAPEPEIPVISEEADSPAELPVEPENAPPADETIDKPESFLTKAAAYIRQDKKRSMICASVVCTVLILGIFAGHNGKSKDTDLLANEQERENSVLESTDSSNSDKTLLIAELDSNYSKAVALMEAGKYDEAIPAFQALGGYKDSAGNISACYYAIGTELMEKGATLQAIDSFGHAGNYKDTSAKSASLRKLYQKSLQAHCISAGRNHTAALKEDGTVVTTGSNDYYQRELGSEWNDLVSVSVGETHTVALKSNGTVLHAGAVNYGQRAAAQWWDIAAICAGKNHTIGLKLDGTVVAAGRSDYGQCDVWYWNDIIAVSTGTYHTAGLKADGTVVATGNNQHNQCNVSDWTDIIAICAGDSHTIGLKSNGTVVAVGYNSYGQCDLSDWDNIVDIGIGTAFTVGLKADGTVVTAGYSYEDLEEVSTWTDIVSISVGASRVAGLKADGTVITVNYDNSEEAVISEWTGIKLPG